MAGSAGSGRRGPWPALMSTSRSWTGPTTTCSSRCCIRSPPGSCQLASSRRAAQRGQETGQRARRARRGAAPGSGGPGRPCAGPGRPEADAVVRQPGGRGRLHGRLLRTRRMVCVRAWPEDPGGRQPPPRPYPQRLRDGRVGHRPGRASGVPDLRGHRSRAYRSRNGRPGRGARARSTAAGVPVGGHDGSEDPADRGGPAGARCVRPQAAALHAPAAAAHGRGRLAEHRGASHGPVQCDGQRS